MIKKEMAQKMECALLTYLRHSKDKMHGGMVEKLHVVLGNESCDLDSVICALSYAFYRHKGKGEEAVPMLNIVRRDFLLRTESSFALQRFGISADHLTFRDDLDLAKVASRLTLVDHNVLTGVHTGLEDRVCHVIDHHVRTRPQTSGTEVEIEKVGSCCTLVAERLINDTSFTLPEELSRLLHETILVDTGCLSEQAGLKTPKDEAMISQLEGLLGTVDREKAWGAIMAAKTDVSSLSVNELLRKDLKFIKEKNLSLAMSSVPMHIHEFFKRLEVTSHVEQFTQEQVVGGVVVMGLSLTDSGEMERQLAVYCDNTESRDKFCATLLESTNPDLRLRELPSVASIRVFSQGDVTMSRKKILPLLVERIKHM